MVIILNTITTTYYVGVMFRSLNQDYNFPLTDLENTLDYDLLQAHTKNATKHPYLSQDSNP